MGRMVISGCTQLTLFIRIAGSGSWGSNQITNWMTVVRFPAMTMSFLFPTLTEIFIVSKVLPCPKLNYSSKIIAVNRNAWSHVARAPYVFRYDSGGTISRQDIIFCISGCGFLSCDTRCYCRWVWISRKNMLAPSSVSEWVLLRWLIL